MIGNQLSPEHRKKNLSQTHLTQNNQILQPAQQGQQLLIVQKQKKGKKQPVKYVKKAGVGNKSKVSQIPKPNEDNDKGPEDTLRTNKRFVGNENNGNSIYINTNNYNLPLMQRDYSGGSYQQSMSSLRNLNPEIQQQFVRYSANVNDYNNAIPINNNNTGYMYQNYNQNAYVLQGSNNQAINNEFDSFHLLGNNGYA